MIRKTLSTKGDRSVKSYGEVVGLKITEHGITPDEGVFEALREELEDKPKSRKQHM